MYNMEAAYSSRRSGCSSSSASTRTGEWFEQLFKHADSCLWQKKQQQVDGNDEYDNIRDTVIPVAIFSIIDVLRYRYVLARRLHRKTESTVPSTGKQLYVDLKPGQGLTLALDTDSLRCTD